MESNLDIPSDSEHPNVPLPKESDFPPGTKFVVKEGDSPFVVYPGPGPLKDRVFSWTLGYQSEFPSDTNLAGTDWPIGSSFETFLDGIRMSCR